MNNTALIKMLQDELSQSPSVFNKKSQYAEITSRVMQKRKSAYERNLQQKIQIQKDLHKEYKPAETSQQLLKDASFAQIFASRYRDDYVRQMPVEQQRHFNTLQDKRFCMLELTRRTAQKFAQATSTLNPHTPVCIAKQQARKEVKIDEHGEFDGDVMSQFKLTQEKSKSISINKSDQRPLQKQWKQNVLGPGEYFMRRK